MSPFRSTEFTLQSITCITCHAQMSVARVLTGRSESLASPALAALHAMPAARVYIGRSGSHALHAGCTCLHRLLWAACITCRLHVFTSAAQCRMHHMPAARVYIGRSGSHASHAGCTCLHRPLRCIHNSAACNRRIVAPLAYTNCKLHNYEHGVDLLCVMVFTHCISMCSLVQALLYKICLLCWWSYIGILSDHVIRSLLDPLIAFMVHAMFLSARIIFTNDEYVFIHTWYFHLFLFS